MDESNTADTPATNQAEEFRTIAASIRNNPHDREAIAAGFDLIAASIEEAQARVDQALSEMHDGRPCEDCGQPAPADETPRPVIDPLDLPDLGAEKSNLYQFPAYHEVPNTTKAE